MTTYPYLNTWLQCLHKLAPPRGLVHVGAGGGNALQYPYAAMPRLMAVEADAQQLARIQSQLQGNTHCQLMQAVVSSQAGEADFHTLSLSNENSLCAAESLQTLWPNIKSLQSQKRSTITLNDLLKLAKDGPDAFNWAFIDCLPAADVLSSAHTLPQGWDVVVVRALKDLPANARPAVQAMSLATLIEQLHVFGLEYLAADEENHPQVVRALFVRNPAQRLAQLEQQAQAQRDQVTGEVSKLIAANAELAGARDQFANLLAIEVNAKADALAQRDAEASAKTEVLAQCSLLAQKSADIYAQNFQLAQENEKLLAANQELTRARDQFGTQFEVEANAKVEALAERDAQAKLAAERLVALEAAAQAKDELSKQLQAQVEQAQAATIRIAATEAEKAQLAAARDAEANAKAEALAQRDAQAKLAADRQAELTNQQQAAAAKQQRLQQLENDNLELASRQNMLQEELIKAEAQIDLIKDLLLREPGL